MKEAPRSRKMAFLYLANDVIQNSRRKSPDFSQSFSRVLLEAFKDAASNAVSQKDMLRLPQIWQDRGVFTADFCRQIRETVTKYSNTSNSTTYNFHSSSSSQNAHSQELQTCINHYLTYLANTKLLSQTKTAAIPQHLPETRELDSIPDEEIEAKVAEIEKSCNLALQEYVIRSKAHQEMNAALDFVLHKMAVPLREVITNNKTRLETLTDFHTEYEEKRLKDYFKTRTGQDISMVPKHTLEPPPPTTQPEYSEEDLEPPNKMQKVDQPPTAPAPEDDEEAHTPVGEPPTTIPEVTGGETEQDADDEADPNLPDLNDILHSLAEGFGNEGEDGEA
eukprot:TRINITY_DN16434_c0_g1_i1.p1 TRINITY_DN16434_c0_g1~~TRINITY_DN16434_c0_g1_i1.p1  ORF type:complete len:393 (-),score=64.35 TRINITY_DN16434_c0_g1_i1:83-1087(-)